jgi:hypothetical protein
MSAFDPTETSNGLLSYKHAVGLPLPHHFLAIGIERVVNDPLGGIKRVIVFITEIAKAFGNGFQTRSFGLLIQCIVGVRAVDDFAEENERAIIRQSVFFQDRFERAFLAVMAEFDVLDVVGLLPSPCPAAQRQTPHPCRRSA